MWREFKKFAFKDNVISLAIGVIIGGAFGKIVTSLVNDLFMPVFGYITAGVDFKDLKFVLSPALYGINGSLVKPESAIMYGRFIQNVVDFLVVSFCIFLFVYITNKIMERDCIENMTANNGGKTDKVEDLLVEIRDLLKNQENNK
ncbi:large-conductance mechanosensitive channel protein MscL [Clostridium cylindrosporum]|uniref:Large-conductance mechanosensitive channel n=1 Tax=Clostridium cylindrosporum DSM 605 TaxID=1121307 RepID=A0A0J8G286_CLOCY|nr:large-conductance mechanosensitive channel protein MscL [Clostridium cylindrosporum]KMT21856.1 large-conductance mechanosensitive channel [Clostridium cylindrosporum DSM 605]